jgi:hypothetical protein
MTRIYLPSEGPVSWRRLLGDPEKHWRAGYSAMTLATCWESADGLPAEITRAFSEIDAGPELLLAIPEHKVPLPGSTRGESQSDLFALIRADDKVFSVTIEGKVDEPFDRMLDEWLVDASAGKLERLAFICEVLGLKQPLPGDVHYQLLHRTAAAIIEARHFKTDVAAMIVHSFSPTGRWFDAFARFTGLFGLSAEKGRLLPVRPYGMPPLFIAWVGGDARFLTNAEPDVGIKPSPLATVGRQERAA